MNTRPSVARPPNASDRALMSDPTPAAAIRKPYVSAPPPRMSRATSGPEHREVEGDGGHHADHQDAQQDHGRRPDIAQALRERAEHGADGPVDVGAHDRYQLRHVHPEIARDGHQDSSRH